MNYTLGTGDQVLIDIYGASQQRYDQKINTEGKIFIPNIGPVELAGLSVEAATARLKSTLTKIFDGLAGANPITFIQLRVGNIRSIQVSMVGEVYAPGNYTLSSFSTVFNALYAAGGVTENGSFREIKIFRNSKLHAEVDVYKFLINGDQGSNIRLQDNDVIMLSPVQKRVEIQGPLSRPGLFELKEGETLQDLIKYAGGFSSTAYPSRAIVYRTTSKELKVENIEQDQFSSFLPQKGDNFIFGEILTRYENRVQVTGALMRPGTFALEQGMGIRELITRAEGLRDDAFLNRATLYRTRPDFSLEIMGIDIGAVVRGEDQDIVLQREDVLHIPSIYEIQEEYYVKVSGEVNSPGSIAYGQQMKVGDLILSAGGFKTSAATTNIEIVRRVRDDNSGILAKIIYLDLDADLKIVGDDQDILLQPFDHVIVRKSPGYQREKLVKVEGEVLYPGEYAITNTGDRISDLLQKSGGLTKFSYPKGATLIRRNEFYEEVSEDQIIKKNLQEVKTAATQDGLQNSEAKTFFLSRIDKKIQDKNSTPQEGVLEVNEFKKNTVENVLAEETDQSVKIRNTEMIGINLDQIMQNPGGSFDLILKEGDVLSIPTQLQTVRMRGEVLFPTTAVYSGSQSFGKYISNSGGFTEESRKNKSYVVYANGSVKRTTSLVLFNIYPRIEPGAEIIVPKKIPKERMSAQSWIGIATSFATLAIMIDRIAQ
jgi:protein involved in polysaccharide export with SLBB domain